MEKEKLLSELKTRVGKTSLSERTLSEYVDNVLPLITNDEQVTEAFYKVHVNILKSMGGNLDHEVASRVDEFKKNYKPEDGEGGNGNDGGNDGGGSDNKELEDLKNTLKELKDRIEKKEASETKGSLLKQVQELMKKNGATDESVLKYTFKGEEIDASKTAEELSEAYLKTYDLNYKELRGDGGAPRGGQEQGAGGKSTGLLDNYFSEKAAEGKFPTENKN